MWGGGHFREALGLGETKHRHPGGTGSVEVQPGRSGRDTKGGGH